MKKIESEIEIDLRLANANAHLEMFLKYFGNDLAKKMRYKSLKGLDAIYFYLIERYHWAPGYVRSLSGEELRFLLTEEMHGWTLPSEVIRVISSVEKKRES